jgi:hypothetical protein
VRSRRYKKLSSAKKLKDKSASDLRAILGVPVASSAYPSLTTSTGQPTVTVAVNDEKERSPKRRKLEEEQDDKDVPEESDQKKKKSKKKKSKQREEDEDDDS